MDSAPAMVARPAATEMAPSRARTRPLRHPWSDASREGGDRHQGEHACGSAVQRRWKTARKRRGGGDPENGGAAGDGCERRSPSCRDVDCGRGGHEDDDRDECLGVLWVGEWELIIEKCPPPVEDAVSQLTKRVG